MKGKLKKSTADKANDRVKVIKEIQVIKSIWRPKVKGCSTSHFNC
jgi:hypothetical protein